MPISGVLRETAGAARRFFFKKKYMSTTMISSKYNSDFDLRLYTTRIFSLIIFIVHTDALLAKIMSILMGLKEWI